MYESNDKMVSHPNHYQSNYGFEVIDVIKEYTHELFGIDAVDTGNMIKYICRWHQKNGIQDLEKAIWYASHLKEITDNRHYNGVRLYFPNISVKDVIKAYTEDLDAKEKHLTGLAIILACEWWTHLDRQDELKRFIITVHELIEYEREKEKK